MGTGGRAGAVGWETLKLEDTREKTAADRRRENNRYGNNDMDKFVAEDPIPKLDTLPKVTFRYTFWEVL